jgi:fermentation-respiration switch protein FrsA (DUF1100 family)
MDNIVKPVHKHWWFRMVIYLIVAYVAWCAILYLYQDRMLFPADMAGAPSPRPRDAQAVAIVTDDGRHPGEAWFYPAPSAGATAPRPVVIFFHGNAELIGEQDGIVRAYHDMGFSVLLPEYRGYGRCPGKPSQKAIREDMVRFYDEFIKRPDVDKTRIVFHGRSLGGGIAADLAVQREPAALILESTFCSISSMSWRYGAPPFLVKHPFRTDRVLARLDAPVLIFHGTRDSIVPVSHGRRLAAFTRGGTFVEFNCEHNDFPGEGNEEAYWGRIRDFLSKVVGRP